MKSTAPSTPYGYTVFCDDVRQETGGKTSHMGIYRSKLIVNTSLPVTIPRLAFVIYYFERPDESTEPVSLHVYMPGDDDNAPVFTANLPVDAMRAQVQERDTPAVDPLISVILSFVAGPVELKSEGPIRVRAYRGDLEIRLGTLLVTAQPTSDDGEKIKEAPAAVKKPKPKKAAPRKRGRSKKPS